MCATAVPLSGATDSAGEMMCRAVPCYVVPCYAMCSVAACFTMCLIVMSSCDAQRGKAVHSALCCTMLAALTCRSKLSSCQSQLVCRPCQQLLCFHCTHLHIFLGFLSYCVCVVPVRVLPLLSAMVLYGISVGQGRRTGDVRGRQRETSPAAGGWLAAGPL